MNKKGFVLLLEKFSDLLPHPVSLFFYLIIFLLVGSYFGSLVELGVNDPRNPDKEIKVINLLALEELVRLAENFVLNFSNFPPLASVLVAMLGVAIVEYSGLFRALIKLMILYTPGKLVTISVVFAGVMSSIAADVGYAVLIPLAAMVFQSFGRNPLAGLAAGFAGVSGGYSANLILGPVDPLLSGITQEAARIIDPDYVVGPEANWYFMACSTFLITIIATIITERVVEPWLDQDHEHGKAEEIVDELLSEREKYGLWWALVSVVIYVIGVFILVLPSDSLFRNQVTGSITNSPFFASIIFFMFFFFAIPGLVYGYITKRYRRDIDVIEAMGESMKTFSMYLVIVFFAAQFLALFSWSNIGTYISIKASLFLQSLDLSGGVLLTGFIMICTSINLMIASATAQWALTAPIFVPILMNLGYSPEVIQAAYRVGDSSTNIITPLLPYLPVILTVAMKYRKDFGVGNLIMMMLPYSLAFLVSWGFLLYLWVFVFGVPLGPGGNLFYPG